jgi:hypothetical protein
MLCVFAPGGAIGAGALLQQLLISLWPGVQNVSMGGLSVDSYFGGIALGALCLTVGLMIKRSAPARGILAASFLFPLLWAILFFSAIHLSRQPTSAVRLAFSGIALAPLLGLGLAYALPSNKRLERQ